MTESSPQAQPPAQAPTSLADMVGAAEAPAPAQRLSPRSIVKIAILGGLFVAMNNWQFRPLVDMWIADPNWSHGFLIPLFSLYLLYARRAELLAAPREICLLGLPIMIVGIICTILGFYPIGTYWISQLNMVVVLFGLVLYLAGPKVIRLAWLPIVYLALAMPIPEMLYARIAVPLQEFAAKGATTFLQLCGVEMSVTASRLDVVSLSGATYQLTVAEACSGIRSLIAYLALGVAWAYLEYRPVWQRVVLVAAAIPVAILVNVIRVTITCMMYVLDRPELGQNFMHTFMGMVMLIPALALLWLLSWVLANLFIEVDEEAPTEGAAKEPK